VISDLHLRQSKYGWIPDIPDQRDFAYVLLAPTIPALPEKTDLRDACSPIENQGTLGSCTACALVGNLELLKIRKLKQMINFSRLFLYFNERLIRRTVDTDSGASLRDGIKTLVKAGDCTEDLWPYDISRFTVKPTDEAYQNAADYQITNYYRVTALTEMKHTLSTGFPFVFGFTVYESFESPQVSETGMVPIPQPTEHLLGGHAVMAVGYDDSQGNFIVRNSWGDQWGDKGYCYIPYGYLANPLLAADFWTIREME
jgi:C1A family cysteine protease